MAKKKEAQVIPEPVVPASSFEPIFYASRGKALTLWVGEGGKKKVQFNNNGVVGVYIAKTEEECRLIEATNTFKNGGVWRVNGELKGEGKPVVSGPRSSLLQAPSLPVDPEIQRTIAESNTQAKRPVSAE